MVQIRNFRALEGYESPSGERMKAGRLFRGGALDAITKEDASYLKEVCGIRAILDLRDPKEAKDHPDQVIPGVSYERIGALQVKEVRVDGFDFGTLLKDGMDAERALLLKAYLQQGYAWMAFANPAYRRLFDLVLQEEGHVYFHCTAGKDRTGVGAFLIMMAVGMKEEDAVCEYLLSNHYLRMPNADLMEQLRIPPELYSLCEPLLYVQQENIELVISSIHERYPDYETFFLREYDLDQKKRKQLREVLCE